MSNNWWLIIKFINSLEYDKFQLAYELFSKSNFIDNEPIAQGWIFSLKGLWSSA